MPVTYKIFLWRRGDSVCRVSRAGVEDRGEGRTIGRIGTFARPQQALWELVGSAGLPWGLLFLLTLLDLTYLN